MKARESYPSKLMLVGEYGVILGGGALTMPLRIFQARVRSREDVPAGMEEAARESGRYLKQLYTHVAGLNSSSFHAPPDLPRFAREVHHHWMEMNIPTGYGLGSSGAVSAAIYERFFPGATGLDLARQKEDLALIESYFHGKSSGVDALTIFADQALYFTPEGEIQRVEFDPVRIPGDYRFFLLDSGQGSQTGPLVAHFLDLMKEPGFASSMRNEYLIVNQKLIEALMGIRDADPALLFRVISDYQFTHFRRMIPEGMLDFWIHGQISNEYYLKLNGSGGGFMLGIAHVTAKESLEDRWKKQVIWIE